MALSTERISNVLYSEAHLVFGMLVEFPYVHLGHRMTIIE